MERAKREEKETTLDERDLVSSLPVDLSTEIFAKLPLESIAKLIFVSKLWSSIVRGKHLTKLFVSRSLARPSFLFITYGIPRIWRFHTRSCGGNRKTSITKTGVVNLSTPVRGLICGEEIGKSGSIVISNPSTGQFVTLPRFKTRRRCSYDIKHFLGYDPINDVYKVLGMTIHYDSEPVVAEEHQVFTLGAKKKEWRTIQCENPHRPVTRGLCRDGVVYYGAWYEEFLLVSFDVRSEDFGVIKLPQGVKIGPYGLTELVNYHGKIALAHMSSNSNVDIWVLEELKKQEWSKISFLLPATMRNWSDVFYCRGTICTGEIIFAPNSFANPFFLVYYDVKRKNARKVDIEGVRDVGDDDHIITKVFLDHVESPMFLQNQV